MLKSLSYITKSIKFIRLKLTERNYSPPPFIIDCYNSSHKHTFYTFISNKDFKIGQLIYSRLRAVNGGTMYLEVYIPDDWDKDHNQTAIQFLNSWISQHKDLNNCNFFYVKIYEKESPCTMIYSNEYEDIIIYRLALNFDYKQGVVLLGGFSVKVSKNHLKRP